MPDDRPAVAMLPFCRFFVLFLLLLLLLLFEPRDDGVGEANMETMGARCVVAMERRFVPVEDTKCEAASGVE